MNWFFIALIAPALWSASNHIDKFLITKYFKGGGTGSLLIFSSLIGAVVFPLIYIFHPSVFNIEFHYAALITLNGFLYILGLLPYIYALQKDEASIVAPLFQMIPFISYILAFFVLGETLTPPQIASGVLIVAGAIILSLDVNDKWPRLKKEIFALMLLSSFIIALNSLLFKVVAIQADYWTTSFWEYVGFSILAVLLLVFVKPYRVQFLSVVRTNKLPVLGINAVNEIVNIIAKLCFNFAALLAPLALVWVVNGVQPFFVFIYGVLLTVFFPKLGVERITNRHLAHKLLAISIMFVGVYFLQK